MNHNLKANPSNYADYLQSVTKLETLEKITQNLDAELADSQRVMGDIKAMFDSIPNFNGSVVAVSNGVRQEDLSKFLQAGVPKVLSPDMVENSMDVDIDEVIATMKGYAEDLKKNFFQPPAETIADRRMENLDLEQYATSLDQLSKRLANIKLNKCEEVDNRNADLEKKLTQLCQDVNMFTQMVQAKTTLSECNKNWSETNQDSGSLYYDNIINKLLSGINEVTYLLQNKN